MAPATVKMRDKTRKRRNRYEWNTTWNNSLKEIGCLLPISETPSGRGLSKKETLIHMLQYFDFLQSHIQSLQSILPSHCLPRVNERESETESEDTQESKPTTPPHVLKAKRKYKCGRPRKKTTLNPESFDDINVVLHEKDPYTHGNTKTEYPLIWGSDQSMWHFEADTSLPSSSDSNYSLNALLPTMCSSGTGSILDQESPCLGSHCSVCDDRTGSEDGSPGRKDLDTPPSGSFLLKDHMLGVVSPLAKTRLPASPTLPQTPLLPFFPLLGAEEGLRLSPSLLTSPAHGLHHLLLPEGQEELQTLFEDVWVTPKPVVSKEHGLLCHSSGDWFTRESGWTDGGRMFPMNIFIESGFLDDRKSSEEEDRGSDDVTWTPKTHISVKKMRKVHRKRISRKNRTVTNPGTKKKCVNGFIMFCRMNRRLYLRTHPGTPSTVVTKELAKLWHIMPKQERRLYCVKARHFSRQQNRNVRSEGQEAEGEVECVPSPLHTLLAQRDMLFASGGKP
ncbi:uncharacterized protein meiosin isoform X2 [Brachyhypopomus gauderio]|uniref:uncharacterized protein meiosin isoform X2 n=1 Tax=Brachyhypopomus gauderio TaxID=698409 RepID=UPI004041D46A